MIKHLVAGAAGVALFFAAAVPAFANSLNINNEGTFVSNEVFTKANTGKNTINDFWDGLHLNQISTGNASALSVVNNKVNTTVVDSCNCSRNITVTNFGTEVGNTVTTKANTGKNTINSGVDPKISEFDPMNVIGTGGASAESVVDNVVNTTVIGGAAL